MKIIIVGAGIAGFSAGIALRRAGHTVIILEQSSLLHEVGAAISVAPNASPVLRSWGFDIAKSQMVAVKQASILKGGDMQTVVPDYYPRLSERFGEPIYAVHRVDLHNQLRELAVAESGQGVPCELHTSTKVTAYDTVNAKVTVEDGTAYEGDLIIAASGVHSTAKDYVLAKDEVVATNTGWASMRWLLPTEDLLSDPNIAPLVQESTIRSFIGENGGTFIWYTCRDNTVQNFLYLSQSFGSAAVTEDFRSGVDADMAVEYAKKDFDPRLQAVIAKAKDVKFWKLVAREPIPRWHKDKIVLIGDAAHPMLPFQAQGGGQAIEDAAALGVLLTNVSDQATMKERLELFEQVRRDRGSSLQVLSNQPPPLPESVFKAVAKYLPEGTTLKGQEDIVNYLYSFDVVGKTKAVLAEHQAAKQKA